MNNGSLIKKTASIFAHPGKMVVSVFGKWYEKKYLNRYRMAKTLFGIDLVLLAFSIGLVGIAMFLFLFPHEKFEDNIFFEATVAPREVISGAPTTLIIRYTNGTEHELHDAVINLFFPEDFQLETVEDDDGKPQERNFNLGSLAQGESGSIKVRGIMYGSLGEAQIFKSAMNFKYADNKNGSKISSYSFVPTKSALQLSLVIPEPIVANSGFEGFLRVANNTIVDLPNIKIHPIWPENFVLNDPSIENANAFEIPGIASLETTTIRFFGSFKDIKSTSQFEFAPYYVFGSNEYKQESLLKDAQVIPSPLQLSVSVDGNVLIPGSKTITRVTYKNTSDQKVTKAKLGFFNVIYDSVNFVDFQSNPDLAEILPSESGELIFENVVPANISAPELASKTNITIDNHSHASYYIDGNVKLEHFSGSTSTPLATPIFLGSQNFYYTSTGDQLGRGPLPPQVGEETSYWFQWRLSGLTNNLTNVKIIAKLAPNVRFTGNQTDFSHNGFAYNEATHSMIWEASSLKALDSASGLFELAIIPTKEQVGRNPKLVESMQVTGFDTFAKTLRSRTIYPVGIENVQE